MKITYTNGALASYIPLNLEEGEASVDIPLRAYPDATSARLRASVAESVTLWGKLAGGGAYQNLSESSLDLSGYVGGFAEIVVKAIASDSLPGRAREFIFLGISSGGAAAWYT